MGLTRTHLRVWQIQTQFLEYMHDRWTGLPLFEMLDELQDDERFAAAIQPQEPVDRQAAFDKSLREPALVLAYRSTPEGKLSLIHRWTKPSKS